MQEGEACRLPAIGCCGVGPTTWSRYAVQGSWTHSCRPCLTPCRRACPSCSCCGSGIGQPGPSRRLQAAAALMLGAIPAACRSTTTKDFTACQHHLIGQGNIPGELALAQRNDDQSLLLACQLTAAPGKADSATHDSMEKTLRKDDMNPYKTHSRHASNLFRPKIC